MKDYKRLTRRDGNVVRHIEPIKSSHLANRMEEEIHKEFELIHRLADLEDKIESGELCEREEVRKITAREILLLLGKGFDETTKKNFKDLQWYEQFCRELKFRYGVDLEDEE